MEDKVRFGRGGDLVGVVGELFLVDLEAVRREGSWEFWLVGGRMRAGVALEDGLLELGSDFERDF